MVEGSIILNMEISDDVFSVTGRHASEIACDLEQQVKDPSSRLRKGRYGRTAVSLIVKSGKGKAGGVVQPRRMLKVDKEIALFCEKRKKAISEAPEVRKARQSHIFDHA